MDAIADLQAEPLAALANASNQHVMGRGYNSVMRNVMNGGDRVFVQCIRDQFADDVESLFLTERNVQTERVIRLNCRAECGRSRIAIEAKRQFRAASLEGNFSRLCGF